MHPPDKTLAWILEQTAACPAVQKVILFGSRAKGNETEYSDYDIAIVWDLSYSNTAWATYIEKLREENPKLNQLDLVRMDLIEDDFRMRIIQEGKVLYDKSTTKL